MNNDWLDAVLLDLEKFAEKNDLQNVSRKLEEARKVYEEERKELFARQ